MPFFLDKPAGPFSFETATAPPANQGNEPTIYPGASGFGPFSGYAVDPFVSNLRALDQVGAGYKDQAQQAAAPDMGNYSVSHKMRNGVATSTVELPTPAFNSFVQDISQFRQLQVGFNAEAQRQADLLSRRAELAGRNPLINLLGTFATNVAQGEGMPPLVQALGRTAAQLNPTAESLRNEALKLRATQLGMAERGLGPQEQAAQLEMEQKKIEMGAVNQDWARHKAAIDSVMQRMEAVAKTGTPPSPEVFARIFADEVPLMRSMTPEAFQKLTQNQYKVLEDTAKAVRDQEGREAATRVKVAGEQAAARLPYQIDLAKERQNARVAAAGGIANVQLKKALELKTRGAEVETLQQFAKLPEKDRSDLSALSELADVIDKMEREYASGVLKGTTGRIAGLWTKGAPNSLQSEQAQVARHLFQVELQKVIQFANAGVRGWSPGEVENLKRLGLSETNTVEANRAIMKEMRERIAKQQLDIVATHKYVPWWDMPDILGGTNSKVYLDASKRAADYHNAIRAAAGLEPAGTAAQTPRGAQPQVAPPTANGQPIPPAAEAPPPKELSAEDVAGFMANPGKAGRVKGKVYVYMPGTGVVAR